jgi:hypothetical protein
LARWELEVTLRTAPEGELEFRGPCVHGRRGERCLYLSWGEVANHGAFKLFRAAAKLRLADVEPSVVRDALRPGHRLFAQPGLTDAQGQPRCARGRRTSSGRRRTPTALNRGITQPIAAPRALRAAA